LSRSRLGDRFLRTIIILGTLANKIFKYSYRKLCFINHFQFMVNFIIAMLQSNLNYFLCGRVLNFLEKYSSLFRFEYIYLDILHFISFSILDISGCYLRNNHTVSQTEQYHYKNNIILTPLQRVNGFLSYF